MVDHIAGTMLNFRRSLYLLLPVHALFGALWYAGDTGALPLIISLAGHATLIGFGSAMPGWNFFLQQQRHGTPGTLALTYDDGPVAGRTDKLLDLLKEEHVHATFFCIGRNVLKEPELARRILAEGHSMGVHTQDHPPYWGFLSRECASKQISACIASIQRVTGLTPRLFRPPYGITSPGTASAIKASGLHSVVWDLRTFDTVIRNKERAMDRTMGLIGNASIILMHDHTEHVLELTRAAIQWAKRNGITLVSL